MIGILKSLPLTFIPIFVAIDIFGVLPIFISLTAGMSSDKKRKVIRDSTVTAMLVSLVFVAIGEGVFSLLGITVNDFKIAGGLILLVLAVIEMIRPPGKKGHHEETISVVPIAVPLIVGPAVLTTLIVLIDHYGIAPTVISLILNLVIVWITLTGAKEITRFFGKNGILAISKVMALLLAAIAVMMIRLGIEGLTKG